MNTSDTAANARIEELRKRLEELDTERTAVSAELHRLVGSESVLPTIPPATKDPISGSGHKDWHVFAGPAGHVTPKTKT